MGDKLINKLIGFIFIALFFVQFYAITSSKEFVCSKAENSCQFRKLFYQNQVFKTYDLDNIDNAGWYWKKTKRFPVQQVYVIQKFVDGEKTVKTELLNTDFATNKTSEFNEYLKNDVDTFSIKEVHFLLIIATLLTAFFLIPFGVVLMKRGE